MNGVKAQKRDQYNRQYRKQGAHELYDQRSAVRCGIGQSGNPLLFQLIIKPGGELIIRKHLSFIIVHVAVRPIL